MIDAVTFDVGGTLADGELQKKLFRRRLVTHLQSLGYNVTERRYRRVVDSAMKDLAKLRKRNLEMRIEDFYSKVLSRLGIVPSDEILESIWMIYCGSYSFFEKKGARETLETLYGRFKLAIVSNSMSGVPRLFLEKCDLIKYFDVVVISRDVGFRKPDPRIFNYALRELNVKPSEAVHVGDLLREDIFGAKNVGMKAIWVCNGKSLGKEDILPDLIANSIADVPKLVDMLNEILSSNSSSFLL